MEKKIQLACGGNMRPEEDLVVIGYIGLKGTSILAGIGEDELAKRLSPRFIARCRGLYEARGVKEIPGLSASFGLAKESGVSSFCLPGEGGVMAALWEYFNAFGLGFELWLKKLPILQETVEVCEVFDLNPYRLQSEGCILATAKNGGALAASLEEQGIFAAVVGRTKKTIGRKIHNGELLTFLDRPKPDELEKIQYADSRVNIPLTPTSYTGGK